MRNTLIDVVACVAAAAARYLSMGNSAQRARGASTTSPMPVEMKLRLAHARGEIFVQTSKL